MGDCSACDGNTCFQLCYSLGTMAAPKEDCENCCGAGQGSCCCCDGLAKHLICVCAPAPGDDAPPDGGHKVSNTAWLVIVTVLLVTALLATLLSLKFGLL